MPNGTRGRSAAKLFFCQWEGKMAMNADAGFSSLNLLDLPDFQQEPVLHLTSDRPGEKATL